MSEIILHNAVAKETYWVDVNHYPDGSPRISIPQSRFETMILRPRTLKSFTAAMFLIDAMAERGNYIQHLIFPHVMGSRQDRLNPQGDYLFTIKSVAKMINHRDIYKVTVLDPHSDVTSALIDRCEAIPPSRILKGFWQGYTGVIAPDAGAAKRAFDVATTLNLEFHQAEKHRDVATGALTGFAAPSIEKGGAYLVVDDICDGGGTFIGLGEIIKERGAYADLYVTHGIFSKGLDELKKYYKNVYTTDSTLWDHDGALKVKYVEGML